MITAFAMACAPPTLRIWVGVFGVENPPVPNVSVAGDAGQVQVLSPLRAIRDAMMGTRGTPLNHRMILEVTGLTAGAPYSVSVVAGAEQVFLTTSTLPTQLPQKDEGTFNVLLCSCYSQPEDASGLLGTVVSQIKLRPHLTLMLGDQIYGDLPLFEDLPGDDVGVARKLGEKYRRNWFGSQLGAGGLGPVLARAPFLCVADDHEYWNNYPFTQTQLPKTWTAKGREQWQRIAKELYEDYQLVDAAGSTQRLEIDPMKILVVDMRSLRDERFNVLVCAGAMQQIRMWATDLLNDKARGKPTFGMLCSGQALFMRAADESRRSRVDAEMGNYAQFQDEIMPILDELAQADIPVVYVTGDVHWGRVAQALDVRSERVVLYEVITSPSRLIRVPVLDKATVIGAAMKGLFAKVESWPRHSISAPVPDRLGEKGHFRLQCDLKGEWGYAQRGDQVAIMSFCKSAGGVDFNVSYYGISTEKELSRSRTTRTYELRNQ